MIWSTARKTEFYRQALLRVLAGLYALAEIVPEEDSPSVVTRSIRNAIFRVLRPAESAARRLIFVETQGMDSVEYVPPPERKKTKRKGPPVKRGKRKPLFRLIDPRKFLEELYPNRRKRTRRPKRQPSTEPRMLARVTGFDGQPDCVIWSTPDVVAMPGDLVDAAQMLRRMEALQGALNDLPGQARRMLREIAKRKAAPPGPRSVPPLRYGPAPGYLKDGTHEVHMILSECHKLAVPPAVIEPVEHDTS